MGNMDCNSLLRKYSRALLVIFNIFFGVIGLVIIATGASIKAYYHEYSSFLTSRYFYASDLLIAIGIIIFLIAFFGCCGAAKENACLMNTFSTLLIIIFILEVLAGIGGIFLRSETEEILTDTLKETMNHYRVNGSEEITAAWDKIQEEFNCCGVQNYTDWTNANSTDHMIPVSCCDILPGAVNTITCTPGSVSLHKEGCLAKFGGYIEGHSSTIGGVGLSLAIAQILGIILSCYLAKQIRSDYETV